MRDLFQQDDGGWLENVGLLDGLVAEKLKAEAETIAAEGWKWIEVDCRFPLRPHPPSARARRHADRPHRRGAGDDRGAATPSTPSSKPNTRTPTNCPTRSTHASARSRRRSPPSRIGRPATIRPRSPAPASSSASTRTAAFRSIAAMSGPRTRRRSPMDGDGEAEADVDQPRAANRRSPAGRSAPSSPSAASAEAGGG